MSAGIYSAELIHFAGNNEIAVTVEQTCNNVFQLLKIAGTLFCTSENVFSDRYSYMAQLRPLYLVQEWTLNKHSGLIR